MAKKGKDSRYTKSFTFNGKRHFVHGRSVQEVDKKKYEKLQALQSNKLEHDNPQLDVFFEQWIEYKMDTVKPCTISVLESKYKSCADIKINGKRFGSYRLSEVTTNDVRLLQKALNEINKTSTTNTKIAFIGQLYKDALNERYVEYNPVSNVKNLKRSEKACRDSSHRALDLAETTLFFNAFKSSAYYNTCKFLLLTGMRCGECGALRYSDIYDGFIHVERTLTKDINNSYCVGDTTKTIKGRRVIPINAEIEKVIENQKQINKILYDNGNISNIHEYLFRAPLGGLLNTSSVDFAIYRTCDKIGIERFSAHAFRDTFATRALESGMQPKVLQELLGHNSFSMTMDLYGHVLNDAKISAMNDLHIAL